MLPSGSGPQLDARIEDAPPVVVVNAFGLARTGPQGENLVADVRKSTVEAGETLGTEARWRLLR